MNKPTKSKTIKLATPIKINGVETDKIELRRLTAGDLESVEDERNERAMVRKLLINVLEITPEEYRQIDLVDLKKLNDEIVGFLA